MPPLITIPHFSWLRRFSIGSAVALLGLSVLLLIGWALEVDEIVQISAEFAPIQANAALGLGILALALLGYELGYPRAGLLALIPLGLGIFVLIETAVPSLGGVDEFFFKDYLQLGGGPPGRMPVICALCLIFSGAALAVAGTQPFRFRSLSLGAAGSILTSVGLSTLLGYVLSLPVVYRWGALQNFPPVAAVMTFMLGAGLLSTAWREHQGANPGAPVWIPLPVIVASATLTFIVWTGLRDSETHHIATNTHVALRDFATAIGREIDRQIEAVDHAAQHWSQVEELSSSDWIAETKTWRNEVLGWQALYRLDAQNRTLEVDPPHANETLISFDHSSESGRRAALERSRERGRATLTGTLHHIGAGDGFAIYAPAIRNNQLIGYAGMDVSYTRFFAALDRGLKWNGDFQATVLIGSDVVFDSSRNIEASAEYKLEEVFDVADRRVRIELSPSTENLRRNRRFLPELALGAGCGITLLLGLSVHLARTARTGLRTARDSNLRLIAENEERRRVEEMLKVSDERLRLALDSTQIGIFEWNLPSNHLYYSPGIWTMLGYEPGRIPSTPEAWTSLIHPEDLVGYREAIERQLCGRVLFIDPEYRVRSATGEWIWLYVRSKSVAQSASGSPTRIIGTLQDVSARKRVEEALRLSQSTTRKLSLVASKTDNLVLIASRDGTIEWVNESFERVMEYSLTEVIGKNPAAFMIGPETDSRVVRRIKATMARGDGISTEVVNYSKSGKKYHLQLEIQPVRNELGHLENFIAIQADISARVEIERNLRRAKAEADAASKAKSDFLASMSHEIRTPMNGVIGMTSLLLDTKMTHEQRDCVNTIRDSGEALLTIINDILDFSKVESGKMELEHLPFEISVAIEDALDLFIAQAAAKKLELVYYVDESVPAWVQGDVTRLRQILVNLVNNAVKFTPAGCVAVQVRRINAAPSGENEPAMLEFSVADTGIGIPPDRMNRLFQPFSQVDSSTTRKYGGTGLGLAISHRLCTLMGGQISVASNTGQGSTFTFTINVEPLNTPPGWGLPELPVRLNYGMVLCIEDHLVTQSRLQSWLRSWGARPVCAGSVEAASNYLAAENPPIAIILDHEMTLTGAGRALRDAICLNEIPTIVLLAAGQSSNDIGVLVNRNGIATVGKPARAQTLVRAMQTLFDGPAESLPPFIHEDQNVLARELPLDVLLVEDNPVNQKVALRFLERLGYRADAVGNGLEALNTLQNRYYHLVLMDLQMPEMDGFEAARQIRRRIPAERQPKIIALTANALHGDREQCLAAGMDDYITKPVKLLDIDRAIRRQFSLGSRPPVRV